jgi:hypothetical protein
MLKNGEANDVFSCTLGKASSFRVVQSKRIRVVNDVGSRAVKLVERGAAVAGDATMVEGTVGWQGE